MDTKIDTTEALGLLIRAARLEQRFTRDQLANTTGLSPRFITEVEAGKPTAQIGKVFSLLAELGIALRAHTAIEISPGTHAASRKRRSPHGH
ncbi:helix-turn-helix transcriptional regulator [Paraburkholderia sp. UCT31]|uniref:helix-turn-helix domain-containing protein n=1 Tax=Paraburkholderia sp. UCT31 TaxID=2615209 RepID=UPI001655F6A4|nr:helix-turn-helix domain-containing protein [Paraburkholderia sp. UCT31]MBC8739819.1 helix-turn-helix transcriptional regulator [Paraburkholderia sp. UCT31]